MESTCSPSCLFASSCNGVECNCRLGYTGRDCSLTWASANYEAWQGVRYMWVSLNAVLFGVATVLFVMHLVRTGRMTKGAVGQLLIMGSALFGALTLGVDPFRFVAATNGYYTQGYRAGLSIFSNLYIAFISCAYSVLVAQWLSIRAQEMLGPDEWTKRATIFCIIMCSIVLVASFLFAGLLAVTDYADPIFYAVLGTVTLFQCAIQLGSCILTLRDLSRLEMVKNHTALQKITIHSFVWGILVLIAVATLMTAILSSKFNETFGLFLGVQVSLPALAALVVRFAFSFHFRYRPPAVEDKEDFRTIKTPEARKRAQSLKQGAQSIKLGSSASTASAISAQDQSSQMSL